MRYRHFMLRFVGGLAIVKRTGGAELTEFINSLHPLDSGVDLIRMGPDGDGGYLIPDDLDGIKYGFSPGVSTESGFEADLAKRGVQVYLADFSVDQPAEINPKFDFDKKYIGCLSNNNFMTLDEWKNNKIPDYCDDLILQMDIEGAEFETIISMSAELLAQFRIMVIEFHYLEQLFNKTYFDLSSRAFQKILQTHSVVHIHPNNYRGTIKSRGVEIPSLAEFTFYRNDRVKQKSHCRTFPHPLDRDNTKKPTLVLPQNWHH